MKSRSSLDLDALWKVLQKLGDTTSHYLAQQFGCSSAKILAAVHQLEEMHPGQIMIHHSGISCCLGKSKEDIERYLLCAGRNQSFIHRAKHIAIYSLKPAQERIGRALLIKAIPERKLLALQSSIDYLADLKKTENKDIIGSFDFDEDGKMMRSASAGRE
jgi:hypothetical protein